MPRARFVLAKVRDTSSSFRSFRTSSSFVSARSSLLVVVVPRLGLFFFVVVVFVIDGVARSFVLSFRRDCSVYVRRRFRRRRGRCRRRCRRRRCCCCCVTMFRPFVRTHVRSRVIVNPVVTIRRATSRVSFVGGDDGYSLSAYKLCPSLSTTIVISIESVLSLRSYPSYRAPISYRPVSFFWAFLSPIKRGDRAPIISLYQKNLYPSSVSLRVSASCSD